MNNQVNSFPDKDKYQDALSSQKFTTSNYNTFLNECSTPAVKNVFMGILNEEHQIQSEIFQEMSKRGWYQSVPAEAQKIQQAKQKFSAK